MTSPRYRDDVSSAAAGDMSRAAPGDTSQEYSGDTSKEAFDDASPRGSGDTSPGDDVDGAERRCLWCLGELTDPREKYCSKRHRQAAYRARRILRLEAADGRSLRLAYADPPYPKLAKRYYGNEPTYAGEVDHGRLLERLTTFDGWALSTSEKALRDVLPLCPPDVRIAAWGKSHNPSPRTRGPHNCWEPVIYSPARFRRPGVRDWLVAQAARFGGTLIGRKPIAFVAWMLDLIGAAPGDEFHDLFPGTGVCSSVWRQFQLVGGEA